MSHTVDLLALMEEAEANTYEGLSRRIEQARSALAELIAAADAVVNSPVPSKDRLAAALARVQGGAK